MRSVNKTRYAILGMLLDGPCSGYEIKALMNRSTVYFWREFDSTIYPMLKILAKEGKAVATVVNIGKARIWYVYLETCACSTWYNHQTGVDVLNQAQGRHYRFLPTKRK